VERRKEPRLKTARPVTLTVLGPEENPARPVMEAQVLDASGGGLRLRVPRAIPCGAPVKVDAEYVQPGARQLETGGGAEPAR
jgi:hypothetical protein